MKVFPKLAAAAIMLASITPVLVGATAASAGTVTCLDQLQTPPGTHGFNACGYNYGARVFSGLADGVDHILDGTVYGVSTYANDYLVMKWNAAWDACNANGGNNVTYCLGAWTTNEWNGMLANGSSATEHVKIIWVGSLAEASPYWVQNGYSIWGNYEVVMDQGMYLGAHNWWALATPNGLH